MKPDPKITVLIPTYNRGEVLEETLDSIFAQTLPVAEVIVADDGSTDETGELITGLLARNPGWRDRLVYFRGENAGKSVALNRAMERVTGDWIAFNDSDDLWHPEKLEEQFRGLAEHPDCGACVTDTVYGRAFDGGKTTFQVAGTEFAATRGVFENASRRLAIVCHGVMMQTAVVQTKIMEELGGFDPELRVSQDADFLFRLSLLTPICCIDKPLVALDRAPERPDRLTVNFPMLSPERLRLQEYMFLKWRSIIADGPPRLQLQVRNQVAGVRSSLANQHLAAGRYKDAAVVLRKALGDRVTPRLLAKWLIVATVPPLARRVFGRRPGLQGTGKNPVIVSQEAA